MALISGLTAAASAGGGGGLIGRGSGILKDAAGKAKDAVEDTTAKIGGAVGIGPGYEEVKGVPEGFPEGPPSGPVAGAVFQGGTGDGTPYNKSSLTLRPGLYKYGDLSGTGVNDKISGIKIKDGFEAVFFKGVEGGKPSGDSMRVKGPKQIPELRDFKPGFENSISSIAVRKIPTGGSGGVSDTTVTGAGAGGGGRAVFFAAVAGILLYVANM